MTNLIGCAKLRKLSTKLRRIDEGQPKRLNHEVRVEMIEVVEREQRRA